LHQGINPKSCQVWDCESEVNFFPAFKFLPLFIWKNGVDEPTGIFWSEWRDICGWIEVTIKPKQRRSTCLQMDIRTVPLNSKLEDVL
jgi:hypothetical protein